MNSMLFAEFAILCKLYSVWSLLLVFHGVVISLLTLCTSQCNFCTHGYRLQKNYTRKVLV